MKIQKYFHNQHVPGSWLIEGGGHVFLQLPGNAQWNRQLTCLENLEQNQTIYLKIANEQNE